MAAGIIPRPSEPDEHLAELSVEERKTRQALGNLVLAAYRTYQSEDNVTPLTLLVSGALDPGRDLVMDGANPVDVVDNPESGIGRWIRAQASTQAERRKWVAQYLDTIKEAAPIIDDIVSRSANRRAMPSEVFARVLGGALNGQDSKSAMLSWLDRHVGGEAPAWTDDYQGELYRLWFDSGLDRMAPESLRSKEADRWYRVRGWIDSRRGDAPMGYGGGIFRGELMDIPQGRGLDFVPERENPIGRLLKSLNQ
jgi:hypothetical protein